MIRRFAFGTVLALGLVSAGRPQVGLLPGGAILPAFACRPPTVTNIGTTSTAGGGSISLSGVTVPAGSLIIVAAAGFGATGGTVSDGSNTYTAVTPSTNINYDGASLFYAPNASLSGGAITYAPNAGNNTRVMSAVYVSSIVKSSPLDASVAASTTGTGNSPSITSGTPTQAGELFVSLIGGDGNGSSGSASMTQDTGDGWAFPPNFSVNAAGAGAFIAGGVQINGGFGTKTFAPTLTSFNASQLWVTAVYGFKHC